MDNYINKKNVTIDYFNQTYATISAIKCYKINTSNYKYLLMMNNTIIKFDKINYHSKNKKDTNKAHLTIQLIKEKKKMPIKHFNKCNNSINYAYRYLHPIIKNKHLLMKISQKLMKNLTLNAKD